jgi:pyruvate,water dikinase
MRRLSSFSTSCFFTTLLPTYVPKRYAHSKTASLGELIHELTPLGIAVPGGFAVTSRAYDDLLDRMDVRARLSDLLQNVDGTYLSQACRTYMIAVVCVAWESSSHTVHSLFPHPPLAMLERIARAVINLKDLAARGRAARQMVLQAGLPDDVRATIEASYRAMADESPGSDVSVAVRSSATAEDLPTASFAGQQASSLNVVGADRVADAVLECLASVFTDRAISYRVHNGFDHMAVKGAVVIQRMVRSDMASSGVAFTLDPDTGFRDVVVITGSYGLGESVVGGKVDPDEVQVFKPMIDQPDPIIRRRIGRKQTTMVYTHDGDSSSDAARTKTIATKKADQGKPSFTDQEAKLLAQWCIAIEDHYSKHHGQSTPMDIEWAKDGITGQLYIVQARPETVRSRQTQGNLQQQTVVSHHGGASVVEGTAIGSDAAVGSVRVIRHLHEIAEMQQGDILVADMTDPDWVPAIRMASAVVTNRGGRTCHAAIVSRELGVPCIVGSKDATEVLQTGHMYTVDCSHGNTGRVHPGAATVERTAYNTDHLPTTRTKIQLILGDPDAALAHASLPVAGVGLVRQEFVVANHIGVHPNAVLFPEKVSLEARREIAVRARNDASPAAFFVRKLAEGVGSIAAAFYPRPVLVRLGDFKSNEYRRLVGGEGFEPPEENPMLGLRGASRYLHPDFTDAFELECQALSHVRGAMGLTNVQLMVPFCRTVREGQGVLDLLAQHGLRQGQDGLEVWVMCELPANVWAMDDFCQVFDGFSIGSNDLTQLVLGVDRDAADLAPLFDEENPAVLTAMRQAIAGAHRHGKAIGLCGQAPSDNPAFCAFLVEQGIDSISLTADAVLGAIRMVAAAEEAQAHPPDTEDLHHASSNVTVEERGRHTSAWHSQ